MSEGVCRTAPATSGLLKKVFNTFVVHIKKSMLVISVVLFCLVTMLETTVNLCLFKIVQNKISNFITHISSRLTTKLLNNLYHIIVLKS